MSPSPDASCGGGDVAKASFARHETVHPVAAQQCATQASAIDVQEQALKRAKAKQRELGSPGDFDAWNDLLAASVSEIESEVSASCEVDRVEQPAAVVLENKFIAVTVTPSFGITNIKDKESDVDYHMTHELLAYDVKHGDAYGFAPVGPATPVLNASANVLASTAALGPVGFGER